MSRNKREGIFYGTVMAFTMSLFMNLFNMFLHAGASMESLGRALLLQPIIFAIVMLVEGLVVSSLAHKAMKRFVQPGERQSESSCPGANGLHGDWYVASDELDRAGAGGHASTRVASTFRCCMAG